MQGLNHTHIIKCHEFVSIIYRNEMSASTIELIRSDNQLFALKKINKCLLFSEEQKKLSKLECEEHPKLSHPHLVHAYGSHEDEQYYYLLLEHLPNA